MAKIFCFLLFVAIVFQGAFTAPNPKQQQEYYNQYVEELAQKIQNAGYNVTQYIQGYQNDDGLVYAVNEYAYSLGKVIYYIQHLYYHNKEYQTGLKDVAYQLNEIRHSIYQAMYGPKDQLKEHFVNYIQKATEQTKAIVTVAQQQYHENQDMSNNEVVDVLFHCLKCYQRLQGYFHFQKTGQQQLNDIVQTEIARITKAVQEINPTNEQGAQLFVNYVQEFTKNIAWFIYRLQRYGYYHQGPSEDVLRQTAYNFVEMYSTLQQAARYQTKASSQVPEMKAQIVKSMENGAGYIKDLIGSLENQNSQDAQWMRYVIYTGLADGFASGRNLQQQLQYVTKYYQEN